MGLQRTVTMILLTFACVAVVLRRHHLLYDLQRALIFRGMSDNDNDDDDGGDQPRSEGLRC